MLESGMVIKGLPAGKGAAAIPASLREFIHPDFIDAAALASLETGYAAPPPPPAMCMMGQFYDHHIIGLPTPEPPSDATSSSSFDGVSVIDQVVDLVERMLDIDPDTRITAEQALRHPFLAPYYVPPAPHAPPPLLSHNLLLEPQLLPVPLPDRIAQELLAISRQAFMIPPLLTAPLGQSRPTDLLAPLSLPLPMPLPMPLFPN